VQNQFKLHIQDNFPELLQNKFLLACSGGLDSVILVHLCVQSELDFSMAHCNFNLRGEESDKDEQFVRQLAKNLNKTLWVEHFDTKDYVNTHKVSVQMAARDLRYNWFNDLLSEHGLRTLVTAHHADDNLETFLINLSRGTGIKGLSGIPAKTEIISRPLLPYSRAQLSAYAEQEKIQWREDQSNAETKYLRNKIRHDIIPLLKDTHPTFLHNFQTTQRNLQQIVDISETHLVNIKKEFFRYEGDIIRISTKSLQGLKPIGAHMYGLFHAYGFTAWDDVVQLLTAMSGKEIRSKTHRLLKDRDDLLLSPIRQVSNCIYEINETDTGIDTPMALSIASVDMISATAPNILYVDKATLKYPMVLRKWQKGDYFYPLGMKGRKKLAKFFKDEKMDVIAKENQWLLCSDNQIVWVVGKRPDERFKITPKTKKILKIILN